MTCPKANQLPLDRLELLRGDSTVRSQTFDIGFSYICLSRYLSVSYSPVNPESRLYPASMNDSAIEHQPNNMLQSRETPRHCRLLSHRSMHAYRHSLDSFFPLRRKVEGRERLLQLLEPELPVIETQNPETGESGGGRGKPGGSWRLRIPMKRPEELTVYKEEVEKDGVVFSPQF